MRWVSASMRWSPVVVMGEPLDALLKEVEAHAGEDYFPAYVTEFGGCGAAGLLSDRWWLRVVGRDKFLVQYISLTPAEFDSFNNEDPTMLQTRLSSLVRHACAVPGCLTSLLTNGFGWGHSGWNRSTSSVLLTTE
jgi:hypothetical protein